MVECEKFEAAWSAYVKATFGWNDYQVRTHQYSVRETKEIFRAGWEARYNTLTIREDYYQDPHAL